MKKPTEIRQMLRRKAVEFYCTPAAADRMVDWIEGRCDASGVDLDEDVAALAKLLEEVFALGKNEEMRRGGGLT